ncbi:hypothetical protein [Proteiniphilum sp. X52]|uniref:hypothetical protein n=1 Tax=Proteiniphilum sp. X52 TaxID=2382159 RepID=UPI000F0A480D|nr:hypothetical protein [Proteiniphilum sp. X52]RNC66471.1 hypothetical protein D7D25_03045 [Proteiniphilum sp. X52]
MKLGDFLNTLAQKVGAQNNPALISLLSNAELANKDLEDDFANLLNGGLMSLEAAKNNAQLRNHFYGLALNGVDSEILNAASELGFDETVIAQLKGDKDTYNKLRGLKDKMIELKDKKSTEDSAGKRAEYQKQIDDLNRTIATLKETSAKDISGLKSQHDAEITDLIIRANLMSKNYANKDLKPEVNAITAKALVDMELANKGAIAVRDGHSIVLKQKTNPELDYYENNVKVGYDDFVTKTLTNSKMLAVSDGKPSPQPRVPQDGAGLNTAAVQDAIAESLADLKTE